MKWRWYLLPCTLVIQWCAGKAQGDLPSPQWYQVFGVAYRLSHTSALSPSFFHSHYSDRIVPAPFGELCRYVWTFKLYFKVLMLYRIPYTQAWGRKVLKSWVNRQRGGTPLDFFCCTIMDAQALSKSYYSLGPRAHVLEESEEGTSCSRAGSQSLRNKDEKREMVPGFSRLPIMCQHSRLHLFIGFCSKPGDSSHRALDGYKVDAYIWTGCLNSLYR